MRAPALIFLCLVCTACAVTPAADPIAALKIPAPEASVDGSEMKRAVQACRQPSSAQAKGQQTFCLAMLHLGYRQPEEALKYMDAAAQEGHWPAKVGAHTAALIIRGMPEEAVFERALQAARTGYPPAIADLGKHYLAGQGTDRNLAYARALLEESWNRGNTDAAVMLAGTYLGVHGGERDLEKNHEWLKKASGAGNARAAGMLASQYKYGQDTIGADPDLAFHYAKLAADKGDYRGTGILALLYKTGAGVETNLFRAEQLLLKAQSMKDTEETRRSLYDLRCEAFTGATPPAHMCVRYPVLQRHDYQLIVDGEPLFTLSADEVEDVDMMIDGKRLLGGCDALLVDAPEGSLSPTGKIEVARRCRFSLGGVRLGNVLQWEWEK